MKRLAVWMSLLLLFSVLCGCDVDSADPGPAAAAEPAPQAEPAAEEPTAEETRLRSLPRKRKRRIPAWLSACRTQW